MSAGDVPWWDCEDPVDVLTATADELRQGDETRRVCLRILDDLYEGRTLYAAANAPSIAAVGRAGLQAHLLNFARNAIDYVHAKVASDIPTCRASGHGADPKQRRRARLLTKFIAGASHELGLEAKVSTATMSMLRTGTGCTKVTERDGRIELEPVNPRELLVDPDDGAKGTPRVLYHMPRVDRRALAARFPDCADFILSAAAASTDSVEEAFDPWTTASQGTSDAVQLYEAWCLPLGDEPGRHVACLNGCLLLDEEWTDPRHPIALTPMTDPSRGTWGHGLLERLDACQFEIDDLISHIGRSIRENNLKILVDDPAGDGVPIEAISDPTVGTIVRMPGGAKAQWVTPQAVSPQDIAWLKELINWLYQIAGMDEGAASSQRPAGLNSGRALQFYHDFQSLRYADLSKRISAHVLAVVERVIDAARRLATDDAEDDEEGTDRKGGWQVRYAHGSEVRAIDWSEVDMERDAFVIELEEASAFPDTLAGRMQQVEQDAAEGRIPPQSLAQLRLDPDLEARWDRATADSDFVDWVVEVLLDPDQELPPHLDEAPHQDLIDALRAEVLRATVARDEPAVIERLQTYMEAEVQALPPPPAPQGPPAPVPQGPTG